MGQRPEGSTFRRPRASNNNNGDGTTGVYNKTEEELALEEEAAARAAEEERRKTEGFMGEWSVVTPASTAAEHSSSSSFKGKRRQVDGDPDHGDVVVKFEGGQTGVGSSEAAAAESAALAEAAEREEEEERRQEKRDQIDGGAPGRRKMTFASLKEKTLPVTDYDDDDLDSLAIKVRRRPKEQLGRVDPLAKAIKQAQTQAPENVRAASRLAGGGGGVKSMFKAVQPGEIFDETPEEAEERNRAAWDLIAPKGEEGHSAAMKKEDDEGEGDTLAAKSASAPLFKKRKAGAAGGSAAGATSSKRRA